MYIRLWSYCTKFFYKMYCNTDVKKNLFLSNNTNLDHKYFVAHCYVQSEHKYTHKSTSHVKLSVQILRFKRVFTLYKSIWNLFTLSKEQKYSVFDEPITCYCFYWYTKLTWQKNNPTKLWTIWCVLRRLWTKTICKSINFRAQFLKV